MNEAESEQLRNVTAHVIAQDLILTHLLRQYFKSFPGQEGELADAFRRALRRYDGIGSTQDDFAAELLADILVLSQAKLDAILQRALD